MKIIFSETQKVIRKPIATAKSHAFSYIIDNTKGVLISEIVSYLHTFIRMNNNENDS